jgi:hypothetical protein
MRDEFSTSTAPDLRCGFIRINHSSDSGTGFFYLRRILCGKERIGIVSIISINNDHAELTLFR